MKMERNEDGMRMKERGEDEDGDGMRMGMEVEVGWRWGGVGMNCTHITPHLHVPECPYPCVPTGMGMGAEMGLEWG